MGDAREGVKEAKFSHGSHLLGGERAYIPAIKQVGR